MSLPNDDDAAARQVKLYLEHGADASVRDRQDLTAADHVSRRGLYLAAEVLRATSGSSE
jgi:hypothetical protein